jgi:hypothetical protein
VALWTMRTKDESYSLQVQGGYECGANSNYGINVGCMVSVTYTVPKATSTITVKFAMR